MSYLRVNISFDNFYGRVKSSAEVRELSSEVFLKFMMNLLRYKTRCF